MQKNNSMSAKEEKKDRLKSLVFSSSFFLILMLILHFMTYQQVLPKPLEELLKLEKVPDEVTMEKFETSGPKGGGGSGQPTDAPLSEEFSPQTEKIVSDVNSESSEVALKGESNHSNQTESSENKASTTVDSDLSFRSGGDGGGNQGGRGKGFGSDDGNGSGSGSGNGSGNGDAKKPRIRLNNPNTENISSDQSCKISLKLQVNAEGDVIRAENLTSKTTTTNQVVINQVISNVKNQVKYNAKPGSALEVVFLTVNITAK